MVLGCRLYRRFDDVFYRLTLRGMNQSFLRVFSYMQAIIPVDIFSSLDSDDAFAIFFVRIGISMGTINTETDNNALSVVNGFYHVFYQLSAG